MFTTNFKHISLKGNQSLSRNCSGVIIRGWDIGPPKPAPDLIFFRLRLVGVYPVLEDSDFRNERGGILVPLKPTPDLIFFRLRLVEIYPVLDDSDGVGFATMFYYLIIKTIKDLCCAVLREIATTCDYAVTNCHGIYFPHFQYKTLPEAPSPFEIKLMSLRSI